MWQQNRFQGRIIAIFAWILTQSFLLLSQSKGAEVYLKAEIQSKNPKEKECIH